MSKNAQHLIKRSSRPLTALLTAAVMSVSFSSSADVQPPSGLFGGLNNLSNFSTAELGVGQDGVGFVGVEQSNDSPTGAPVSLTTSATFGSEDNGFFSVTGSAFGSSNAGVLRASGQVSVTENSVFDPGFAPPYLPDDPEGIPTSVNFTGYAGFTDRLQYGGTAVGYTSRYLLRLTGNITGNGIVFIDITHGSSTQSIFFSNSGTFNETIATETFVNGNGLQEFSIRVQATADVLTEFDFAGSSASANFSNTLEIIGLEVRDSSTGQLVETGVVTTSAGFSPVITQVPEPTTAVLLAMAGVMLAGRRRRPVA